MPMSKKLLITLAGFAALLYGAGAADTESNRPPHVTFVPVPTYTEMARVSRITGSVRVRVTAAANGAISRAVVVDAETHPGDSAARRMLSEIVLNNIRQWRFEAAPQGGADRQVTVEYVFRLEGEPDPCGRTRVTLELPGKVELVASPPAGFN